MACVTGRCQACGIVAPVKYVDFKQNVGMLLMRKHKTVAGNLCKPCCNRYFWSMTGTTLAVGWIGQISIFIAPIFIINNVVRYIGVLGMPGPGAQAKKPQGSIGGRAGYTAKSPYSPATVYTPPQAYDASIPFDDEQDATPVELLDESEIYEDPAPVALDPEVLLKPHWPNIVARLKAKESLGVVAADLADQTGLSSEEVSEWVIAKVKRAKEKAAAKAGV